MPIASRLRTRKLHNSFMHMAGICKLDRMHASTHFAVRRETRKGEEKIRVYFYFFFCYNYMGLGEKGREFTKRECTATSSPGNPMVLSKVLVFRSSARLLVTLPDAPPISW